MILFHISLLRVVPSRLGRLPILVPLRFSWQTRRRAGQLMAALLQVFGETALASSVHRRLSRETVKLAALI
jgi:hypothetical protein